MSKSLDKLTKDERSLLLFVETAAVDMGGRFHSRHTNEDDHDIMERWQEEGFLSFGRIISADVNPQGGHWVELSEEAFKLAHQERRARAARMLAARRYRRSGEEVGE